MNDRQVARRIDQLRTIDLFCGVPVPALEYLARNSVTRLVETADTLFRLEAEGDAMYLILSGTVWVEQPLDFGSRGFAIRRGPGEVVGEMALLDDKVRTATVRALEPTSLLVIPRVAFQDALGNSGEFRVAILANHSRRLRAAWDRIHVLQTESLDLRIIRKMVEIAEEQLRVRRPEPLRLRLTRSDIARLTSAHPQQVGKVLARIKQGGLIKTGPGKVTILDLSALRTHIIS